MHVMCACHACSCSMHVITDLSYMEYKCRINWSSWSSEQTRVNVPKNTYSVNTEHALLEYCTCNDTAMQLHCMHCLACQCLGRLTEPEPKMPLHS